MLGLGTIAKKVFGTPNDRRIKATRPTVERINAHPMRRLGVSRRALFESIEQPALRPLPAEDYEYAEWRLARVNLDYHIEAEGFLTAARYMRNAADELDHLRSV